MATWSKDSVVDFIEYYRSFECLWKIKSKDYSNKMKREHAYEELIQLNYSFFQRNSQASSAVWGRNLEYYPFNNEPATDVHQWVPQDNFKDQVARKDQQPRAVAANEANASRARDPSETMGWVGHTLRKPGCSTTRRALTWNPQGKRKRGRPTNTWRRDLEADTRRLGHTWKQLESLAGDRDAWRTLVGGLCPTRCSQA
ncbi:hypothetical protein RRG08_017842 [Elysia crispata]|uniref:MADF domain-containing protein n=1 Tax=Elysia crispata TaxID=231223 RepID=A0AAE0XPN6_9GAST|nr:hypothetical protein RRG08_017842 [Elysia crispata]